MDCQAVRLGEIVLTSNVKTTLSNIDVQRALQRHSNRDWGELCPEDVEANENALHFGLRLFSIYCSSKGVRFYVITKWDRSVTTIALEDEYFNITPRNA